MTTPPIHTDEWSRSRKSIYRYQSGLYTCVIKPFKIGKLRYRWIIMRADMHQGHIPRMMKERGIIEDTLDEAKENSIACLLERKLVR